MKVILSVSTTIPASKGNVWYPAEFEVPDSLDPSDAEAIIGNILNRVRREGVIRITRILFRRDRGEDGASDTRVVTGRYPMILGRGAIGHIEPMAYDLMEIVDA